MRITSRCGGSHVFTGPPSGGALPSGISMPVGNCHAAVSAVIAVQTSSGRAGSSTSRVISNSRLMRELLLVRDGRMQRDDEPVRAPAGSALVVVLRDEPVDGFGELTRERRAGLRRGKAHLAVDPERRKRPARGAGACDQI